MNLVSDETLPKLANVIRGLAIDAVETAGHGHPGAAMGMADIASALYAKHLKYDAKSPEWHDRDRVILSNGHSSILLYSLLYLTGVPGIELDDIKTFRKAGSKTPGHPEVGGLFSRSDTTPFSLLNTTTGSHRRPLRKTRSG